MSPDPLSFRSLNVPGQMSGRLFVPMPKLDEWIWFILGLIEKYIENTFLLRYAIHVTLIQVSS